MTGLAIYAAGEDARAAFTITETAHILGVSVDTVRRAIRDGRLHVVALSPQTRVVPAWSIQEALEERDD